MSIILEYDYCKPHEQVGICVVSRLWLNRGVHVQAVHGMEIAEKNDRKTQKWIMSLVLFSSLCFFVVTGTFQSVEPRSNCSENLD